MPIEGIDVTWVGGIVTTILLVIMYVAIGILFVAGIGAYYYFMIYRKKLYNVDCIIWVKRQEGLVMCYDKGGFITKKKMSKFRLLKRKYARIAPPDYSQIIMNEKGRNTLNLYKYGEQDYVPCKPFISDTEFKLVPVEGLSKDAVVQDIREILVDLDKPSTWEKWAVPITLLLAVMIIMAGTYVSISILAKSISANASAYTEAAKLFAESSEMFARSLGVIQGTG